MVEVDYPVHSLFTPERFEFGVRGSAQIDESMGNGSMSITPSIAARFICVLSFAAQTQAGQAEREALFVKLSGQRKLLRMWHLMRPEPLGTLRGNPTTAASAVSGATTVSITCATSATLKAGDMLGIGGQAVMVVADAVESGGTIAVTFANELRAPVNSGVAVVWDRPKVKWINTAADIYLPYQPGRGERFTVSYVEVF